MDSQKLRDLLDQRDAIDRQIVEVVGGKEVKERKPQSCGKCGEQGHSARTCSKIEG